MFYWSGFFKRMFCANVVCCVDRGEGTGGRWGREEVVARGEDWGGSYAIVTLRRGQLLRWLNGCAACYGMGQFG